MTAGTTVPGMTQPPIPPQPEQPFQLGQITPAPEKRRRVWPYLVGVGVAVALAVGGTVVAVSDENKPTPAGVNTSSTPASAIATSAPSPTPTDETLKIGQVFEFKDGSTQVLRYKQPVGSAEDIASAIESDELKKGGMFGSIEVRTCIALTSAEAQPVGAGPWSLGFSDGTVQDYKISDPTPGTGYPFFGKTVRPGKCVKGWITFPIPPKVRPTVAVYEGGGNVGNPTEWKLS